ncbi:MAG: glutathione S-transferase family protein [Candidatus Binatia bacterium]
MIDEYLEEKHPQPSLLPKDPYLRARARIWIDFCNTRIHGAAHEIRRGKDPEAAKQKLNEHFAALEQALATQDYLIGTYSLADVTFIPVFTRLPRYGTTLDGSFSRVRSWSERLLERAEVQTTLIPPQ